jgi:peptidoglycan/LPS O-acetylase OafA/YrhL
LGTFRFFLAIAVVVSHFGDLWGHRLMDGLMAVQCFYMVSGFLISLILSGKYDTNTPAGLRLFYTNRALRIFVPYWTFCLLIIVAEAIVSGGAPPQLVQQWAEMSVVTRVYLLLTNIFVIGQEWTMWLSYEHGSLIPVWSSDGLSTHPNVFHVIPQAWSMSLELMFYALAPFLVRRHWLILVAYIAATYAARKLLMTYGFTGSGFAYRFFPVELGLFLAGVLAHRVFAFADARRKLNLAAAVAVSAALISMMFIMRYWDTWESHRFYALVAVALPSLFVVSRHFAFDRWLGDLSYPIYLCHLGVLSVGGAIATRFVGPIEDRDTLSLVLIGASVAIAIAYVHWIDAPFERWRQRRAALVSRTPIGTPELAPALAGRRQPRRAAYSPD